ncbi:hypothetical protein [Streptomyces sp. NPDC058394]
MLPQAMARGGCPDDARRQERDADGLDDAANRGSTLTDELRFSPKSRPA